MDSDVEIGEEWEPVDGQLLLADDRAQEPPAAAAADAEEDRGFLVYLNEDEGGDKGKRQLARRPTYSREERQAALLVHRAHALCLLAMGSLDDAAAGDPMLQAVMLSRLEGRLAATATAAALNGVTPAHPPAPAPDTSLLWLQQLVGWWRATFRLTPPNTLLQQQVLRGGTGQPSHTGVTPSGQSDGSSRDPLSLSGPCRGELLLGAAGGGGGDEEAGVVLLVALLRSLGHMARLVRNLDVLPMKPGAAESAGALPAPRSLPRAATAPAAAATSVRKQLGLSSKRRQRSGSTAAAQEEAQGDAAGVTGNGSSPAGAPPSSKKRRKGAPSKLPGLAADAADPPGGTGEGGEAGGGGTRSSSRQRALRGDEEFERQLQMALASTAAEAAARDAVAVAGTAVSLGVGPSSSSSRLHVGSSRSVPLPAGTPSGAAASGNGSSKAAAWSKFDQSAPATGYSWSAAGRCTPRTWAEVYCGSSTAGRWVAVDLVRGWVDCADRLEGAAAARQPLRYVVAFQGGTPKDVTRRYVSSFPVVAKQRDEDWWGATMAALRRAARHMPAAMAAAAGVEGAAAGTAAGTAPAAAAVAGAAGPSHTFAAPSVVEAGHRAGQGGQQQLGSSSSQPPPSSSAGPHTGLNGASEDHLRLAREEAELAGRAAAQAAALPTTIDAFKQHPLYVLERHITKYCALAPGAKPLGAHRGEAFFSRIDVQELHTAERWRREGRDVRAEELPQPAKVVKKRPQPPKRPPQPQPFWRRRSAAGGAAPRGSSNSRGGGAEDEEEGAAEEEEEAAGAAPSATPAANSTPSDEVQLYGHWQTDPWTPPAAQGGKVPKNSRGNVEVPPLAQALPAGTVHLQLPGVGGVCRRLGVDYAPALAGFEVQGGRSVPKIDGVVVCEEFAAQVTTAYLEQEQQRAARAAEAQQAAAAEAWRGLLTTMWTKIQLVRRYATKGGLLPAGLQQQQQQERDAAQLASQQKQAAAGLAAEVAEEDRGAAAEDDAVDMVDNSDEEVEALAAAAAAKKAGVTGGRKAADILKQHYHNEAPGTSPAAAAKGAEAGKGGAARPPRQRKQRRHLLQEAAQLAEQGKVAKVPTAAAAAAAAAAAVGGGPGPPSVDPGALVSGAQEQEEPGDDMQPDYEEF